MPHPGPKVVRLDEGKCALCTCGKTGNAPFCDGSHAGTEFTPQIVDVEAGGRTCAWCTCRQSGNMPNCDGSHAKLP